MSSSDFICLALAPVLLMLGITFSRNFRLAYGFSLVMFIAAFVSLFIICTYAPHNFGQILVLDNYSILFLGVIYIAAILITILSYEYLRIQAGEREEYFIILFVAVFGATVLVMAEHFVTFFLGLETLSISLYVMIAYLKWRDQCIEAGVKFLVIASLSTSFLLFGMGLIYAGTGMMTFRDIFNSSVSSPLLLAGFGLMLAGIGFKLALVPFHMWTPDVYQGAPAPVTTFIATISKGSILALALRFFIHIRAYQNGPIIFIVSIISVLSMFTGNLLALKQTSVKRLLAYSSIAQLGYMMIALLAGPGDGTQSAIFYIAAYILTSIAAFGVVSVLSVCEHDADNLEDFKGLFWSNPWMASVLTIAFISLAGLPLTAGFIAKFYLVLAGARVGLWLLAVMLVINSVISIYYYLRVVKTMFSPVIPVRKIESPVLIRLILVLVIAGVLFLGILPSFFTQLINAASSME